MSDVTGLVRRIVRCSATCPAGTTSTRPYGVNATFTLSHGLLQNRQTVSHAEISAWQASAGDALNRFYLPKLRESEGTPGWRLAI
jgi:hypothetical protein